MGIHTGEASLSGEGQYYGVALHRAARICGAAHGGQVLISHATQALLLDEEDDRPRFVLKDLEQPLRLYQLLVEGLPASFPAPRTLNRRSPLRDRRVQIAAAAAVALGVVGAVLGVVLTGGSSSHHATPPRTHGVGQKAATLATLLQPQFRRRVHAVMSPYDFFPIAAAPAGMVLDGTPHLDEFPSSLPRVCGPLFTASYAAPGGKQLVWSTSRDCDSGGVTKCHTDG